MAKTLNEIYRVFISNQYPIIVANLKIPTDSYDVNVSPDKRTIFIHQENKIMECIMEQLKEQLEPSRSTFQVNALMSLQPTALEEKVNNRQDQQEPCAKRTSSLNRTTPSSSSVRNPTSSSRVQSIAELGSFAMSNTKSDTPKTSTKKRSYPTTSSTLLTYMSKKPKTEVTLSLKPTAAEEMEVDELEEDNETEGIKGDTMEIDVLDKEDGNTTPTTSDETSHEIESEVVSEPKGQDTQEYVEMATGIKSYNGLWKTNGRTLSLKSIDLTHPRQMDVDPAADADMVVPTAPPTILKNASVKNTDDNEKATKALSRVISKPDFARMQVLGQFNLGFMITCLDDQDLYIIDQHASDEKYNFETLQRTTQIKGQRLLRYALNVHVIHRYIKC